MSEVPPWRAPRPDIPRPDGAVGTSSPEVPIDFPDDPSVAVLLHQLPEFETAYLELVAAFDDAPGGPAVFTELAEFVSARLTAIEVDRPVLERALGAIEMVAEGQDGQDGQDGESAELIGYAFLDSLSPDDRRRIQPWLGPRTRALLDELDVTDADGLLGDPPDSLS